MQCLCLYEILKRCFSSDGNEISENKCRSNCCTNIRIYQPRNRQISNRTPKEILEYYMESKNEKLKKLLNELQRYNELETEVINSMIQSMDNSEKFKDSISKLESID